MIEIKKSRAGFRVIHKAKNGEPLCVSEVLNSLANAKKNIRAMKKVYRGNSILSTLSIEVHYNGKTILV